MVKQKNEQGADLS